MSTNFTTITLTPEEYQARLTNIAHDTVIYLANQGNISEKEMNELLEEVRATFELDTNILCLNCNEDVPSQLCKVEGNKVICPNCSKDICEKEE